MGKLQSLLTDQMAECYFGRITAESQHGSKNGGNYRALQWLDGKGPSLLTPTTLQNGLFTFFNVSQIVLVCNHNN